MSKDNRAIVFVIMWTLATVSAISASIVLRLQNHNLKKEHEVMQKIKDSRNFELHRQLERCDERVTALNNAIATRDNRRGDSFIK